MKKSLTLASFALLALASAAASAAQPAGQRDTVEPTVAAAPSTLTRQQVENEVIEARAHGELIAAGEDLDYGRVPVNSVSTLTRAQVRADVLAARAAGELTPSGEGSSVDQIIHRRTAPAYFARRNSTADKVGG
jgi:hypothetical protein